MRTRTNGRKLHARRTYTNGRTHTNGRVHKTLGKIHRDLLAGRRKAIAAKGAMIDIMTDAKEKFGDLEHEAVRYAKQNPLRSMGFSMLAGLVLAQLFHLHR